ncbi:hypothetical protein MPTK1_3g24860 [Marchantia polymorpha subsp. ruderalis]|uniref:Uncharacterized protein n=2 Tax=Marchantia polymorpha TaxID=3197 RepID=A0AAF6B4H4_MARPO|nr:hypothetical protein MARPO_0183s0018 [Marchantia polymorpha]BBN06908.1 hypothetical protein Mp_3g24860 [Marchantia polymorpha subsp. ruderalis]|eukprot:PTQ27813.1 hypothetical protein MARPO_0183s0018 [Marchantia polymorpha]
MYGPIDQAGFPKVDCVNVLFHTENLKNVYAGLTFCIFKTTNVVDIFKVHIYVLHHRGFTHISSYRLQLSLKLQSDLPLVYLTFIKCPDLSISYGTIDSVANTPSSSKTLIQNSVYIELGTEQKP